jgi:hypothetical protein
VGCLPGRQGSICETCRRIGPRCITSLRRLAARPIAQIDTCHFSALPQLWR